MKRTPLVRRNPSRNARNAPSARERGFASAVGGWLDAAALVISPRWGARRLLARSAFRVASERIERFGHAGRPSVHDDRIRGKAWLTSQLSADGAIERDLAATREKCRELASHNSHLAGAVEGMLNNCIGGGIVCQSRIDAERLGLSADAARAIDAELERLFGQWARGCDRTGRQSLVALQRQWLRNWLVDGEVFVVLSDVGRADKPVPLALETIDADRVSTPDGEQANSRIRNGIEFDAQGAIVAYHIRSTHPHDDKQPERRWQRIRADRVLHLFEQQWPGQTRGWPWLAPVIEIARDMGDCSEAALVNLQIAACFAAFVQVGEASPEMAAAGAATQTDVDGRRLEDLSPGMIQYLGQGQDVKFANPNQPQATYAPFMDWHLHAIAAALGYPYELLAKDYSGTTYSSGRLSLIDGRIAFKVRQQAMIERLLRPIWERFVTECVVTGASERIDPRAYAKGRVDYQRGLWQAPGWPWIDPTKEVAASDESIQKGLSTHADELAGRGLDYQEITRQRDQEQRDLLTRYAGLKAHAETLGLDGDELRFAVFGVNEPWRDDAETADAELEEAAV